MDIRKKLLRLVLWLLVLSGRPLKCSLAQVTNAILPIVCDAYQKHSTIPLLIQGVDKEATGGLTCQPSCTTPDENYHFQLTCDASALSDKEKESYCSKFQSYRDSEAKLLDCPDNDCFTDDDGNIVYTGTCHQPVIALPTLSIL